MVGMCWWLGASDLLRRLMPGLWILLSDEVRARECFLKPVRRIHFRVTRTDGRV